MPVPSTQNEMAPAAKSRRPLLIRVTLLALVFVLLAGATVGWLERTPLLAWYCIRGLARAGEADRDVWVQRVADLDGAAVPGLLVCLTRAEPQACANAEAALAHLIQRWQNDESRRNDLAERLADAYPRLSAPGQQVVLKLEAGWLAAKQITVPRISHLLMAAASSTDCAVHARALDLAAALLDRPDYKEVLGDCQELTRTCLRDAEPAMRARAVQLAQHPGMGLLEQVFPLLNDPAPEVRREAMLAARTAPEALVKTESLLRWLHDPDDDVRRLCEAVLRGRNLTEEQLRLGRLLTDTRPSVRLQVLSYLHDDTDLEPGVWLRLLSIDPEPAVRVAAVRAAVADPRVDLSDRIDQIIRSDPSPTVAQLARYYFGRQLQRKSPGPAR